MNASIHLGDAGQLVVGELEAQIQLRERVTPEARERLGPCFRNERRVAWLR